MSYFRILLHCVGRPHISENYKLKSVQHHMDRFVLNDFSQTISVTCILGSLHWATLAQHHTQAKLMTLYKIISDIPAHKILIQSIPPYLIRSHCIHHFKALSARLKTHRLSFFFSSTVLWNALFFYHLKFQIQTKSLFCNHYINK